MKQLDWGEVIIELDYPQFMVSDPSGVALILKAYHLGTTDPFPVTAIYRLVLLLKIGSYNDRSGNIYILKLEKERL